MNKIMTILLLTLVGISTASAGTYVVRNAVITKIANTSSNENKFAIFVEGGTGSCVNEWVHFPESAATSKEIHERAYSAALAAMTAGIKVTLHNYHDEGCRNVSYIQLVKGS